ncbi:VOC family protein [Sphingobacterium daejeonense]|uniref:VOC family protein n=1 Tax=Sphingobacterium daejeonense TaxID=371142 RepID=A0ABW3RQQ6_9SPHI
MKSSMIWANFSVKNADRSREFYNKLGLTPNGPNNDPKLASFKFGKDNFVIHFFQEESIKEFLPPWENSNNEIIFTLSAETKNEVEEWYKKVVDAGGIIIKEPIRDKEGYFGFVFSDPDGHRFNVLLMDNM